MLPKPYQGEISDWSRIKVGHPDEFDQGFYVVGQFQNHPWLRGTCHTSMVVREYKNDKGESFIETMNSIYKLM